MASAACPSCGASAVTDASGDGISQVCTVCGAVVDIAPLCLNSGLNSGEGLSFVPSAQTATLSLVRTGSKRGTHYQTRLSRNRLQCNDWIKQEGAKLGMDPVMRDEACNFFNMHVARLPLTQQLAFAAACCYRVLRNNNQCILLHTLSSRAQCSGSQIWQALGIIREITNQETVHSTLDELLPEAAQFLNASERKEVVSRATALLKPLRTCWFLEGRSPHNLAAALVFIAWKSLDIATRTHVTYAAYCQRYSLSLMKATNDTVRSLNKVLIQLAGQIPWLKGKKLSPKQAPAYVEDITRYSASLAIDAIREVGGSDSDQTATEVSAAIFKTFRKSKKRPSCPLHQDTDSPSKSCDDGGVDFSDSEIDNYIRSEQEAKAVKEFLESHERKKARKE
uniref:Putative transcription initiation factor brf2 ixodes scapularis transcription initiation factor brf2 n=1 Tax=Amblyomma cajennense TaxID=34607 RepID=A0A023FKX6_AMBCJ